MRVVIQAMTKLDIQYENPENEVSYILNEKTFVAICFTERQQHN